MNVVGESGRLKGKIKIFDDDARGPIGQVQIGPSQLDTRHVARQLSPVDPLLTKRGRRSKKARREETIIRVREIPPLFHKSVARERDLARERDCEFFLARNAHASRPHA